MSEAQNQKKFIPYVSQSADGNKVFSFVAVDFPVQKHKFVRLQNNPKIIKLDTNIFDFEVTSLFERLLRLKIEAFTVKQLLDGML
jgi:hypothetical protein